VQRDRRPRLGDAFAGFAVHLEVVDNEQRRDQRGLAYSTLANQKDFRA